MRRALRWLACLLPPGYVLAIAGLFYLVIEFLAWQVAGSFKGFFWPANGAAVQEIFRMRNAWLTAAAAAYGAWRVLAFHPFYRSSYAAWLKQTPWTSRYPLPMGPIRLAAPDVAVAAILLAATHSFTAAWLWIPVMLLVGHGMAVALALFWTGPRWTAYAIGFLLGLLVLVSREPIMVLATAVAISLAAHGGIRSSLARFPWDRSDATIPFLLGLFKRPPEVSAQALGYPYDGLSPHPPELCLPLRDGIALSLLPAWWAFAAIEVLPEKAAIGVAMLCVYFLPFQVGIRSLVYLAVYWPPISLWGRIVTGRWIIPGYDQALAAPLLATVLGIGLAAAGIRYKLSLQLVLPACISAVTLVTLTMGPSLLRVAAHRRLSARPSARPAELD